MSPEIKIEHFQISCNQLHSPEWSVEKAMGVGPWEGHREDLGSCFPMDQLVRAPQTESRFPEVS